VCFIFFFYINHKFVFVSYLLTYLLNLLTYRRQFHFLFIILYISQFLFFYAFNFTGRDLGRELDLFLAVAKDCGSDFLLNQWQQSSSLCFG